jgi:small subunit ribosomal protein S20
MANTKSAEKRNSQNVLLRERNRSHRSRMRTAIKRFRTVVESGDASQAQELLGGTMSVIDATAQKGIIHSNTADRYKSRLAKAVASLAK